MGSKRKSGQGLPSGKAKALKPASESISAKYEHIGKVTDWFFGSRFLLEITHFCLRFEFEIYVSCPFYSEAQ